MECALPPTLVGVSKLSDPAALALGTDAGRKRMRAIEMGERLVALTTGDQRRCEVDPEARFGPGKRWVELPERGGEHVYRLAFADSGECMPAPPAQVRGIQHHVRSLDHREAVRQQSLGRVERAQAR